MVTAGLTPPKELGSFWKEVAERELNETEETKREGLAHLRELIRDKKLKTIDSDEFLLRFLRARKFKPQNAFKLMENYLAVRLKDKDLFSVSEALKDVERLGDGWQCVLQGRDNKGRAVFVFRPGMYRLVSERSNDRKAAFTVDESFRMNFLAVEYCLLDPRNQISGLTAIVDLKGFSLKKHSLFLSPYHSMRTSCVVQDTIPLRFGGFHVVNQPRYIDAIYALFRPFLKDKIRNRVYFHGSSFDELHKHINPEVLPVEFGGMNGSIVNAEWKQRLLSKADKIREFDPSLLET